MDGRPVRFCCSGCSQVFQILSSSPGGPPADFKNTDLYRSCLAAGLIALGEEAMPKAEPGREDANTATPSLEGRDEEHHAEEAILKVDGMWCQACSWLIEHLLKKKRGIVDVSVFFLTDLARIKYSRHLISLTEIVGTISHMGYKASALDNTEESSLEKRARLLRLGISSILTANIMMISFSLYFGFFQELGKEAIRYFSYVLCSLATPVVFYCGFPILKRAFLGVRYGTTSMDTLIALGALSAYAYSLLCIIQGALTVYFDTAAMLVTLVLLGRHIETQARRKVSKYVTQLYQVTAGKVRICNKGKERWLTSQAVSYGDEFLVLPGERIPLDGTIVSGAAVLDESILTGESHPIKKCEGEDAMGGALVLEGTPRLRATRVGEDTLIAQIISLIQEALTRKIPAELLADRITKWFVPAILILALCTAMVLLTRPLPPSEALLRALTVLVITCPCALGIATPLAKVAAIGVGRTLGILFREPAALEKAKYLDTLFFDKTGTLTQGRFTLMEVAGEGVSEDEALRRIASVEVHSDHFLAREILRKASKLSFERASSFQSYEGMGVSGTLDGKEIVVGNVQLLSRKGIHLAQETAERVTSLGSKGYTVVYFAWDGAAQGFMLFGDRIRPEAGKVIYTLRSRGIQTWLISGDAHGTTQAVAAELQIDHSLGQVLPRDKVENIRELQKRGLKVGMVGDGINDAAALAQADVGFAFGAGASILQEASDITLLGDNPAMLMDALNLSGLTHRIMRQNLFFAFFYNFLGIPLAVSGFLNPLVAVFAMFLSSLTVIGNTLRIWKFADKNRFFPQPGGPGKGHEE